MKYQDTENTVNGFTVGNKIGTPIKDALNPTDDGYDHLRTGVVRIGTMLQDADGEQPIPLED